MRTIDELHAIKDQLIVEALEIYVNYHKQTPKSLYQNHIKCQENLINTAKMLDTAFYLLNEASKNLKDSDKSLYYKVLGFLHECGQTKKQNTGD